LDEDYHSGSDGYTLQKGVQNFFRVPRGFDLSQWVWLIASQAGQDVDILAC
jgi:hypothetical protein